MHELQKQEIRVSIELGAEPLPAWHLQRYASHFRRLADEMVRSGMVVADAKLADEA